MLIRRLKIGIHLLPYFNQLISNRSPRECFCEPNYNNLPVYTREDIQKNLKILKAIEKS
uniref:Uncharacterized protein n=1 Tax=Nelumbo nucifera TaxID=4432 RepID=A0A822XUD9_NELNU|nr:TPA_asm: hypothetical protein HUJ06_022521 [Nelumbo nucifera]